MVINGGAQAATIQGTILGTITSGTDSDSLFGGGDLTGDSVSLSFSYDPDSCPPASCSYNHFGSQETLYYLNTESISVSVNSQQQNYTSIYAGVNLAAIVGQGDPPTLINLFAQNASGGYVGTFLYSSYIWAPGQIYDAAAIDAMLNSLIPSVLQLSDGQHYEYLDFAPLQTTPLPAALPLFAAGLGVMGWLAQRKKRKAAAAAAA